MEIAIPFNQAQEIALICRDELGLSVRYRALLHRRATRENPRLFDNVCYDADEFLDLNLFDGQHSDRFIWLIISPADYAIFKLRFLGAFDYLHVP